MNFRFEKWGVRFHVGLTLTAKVTGVNSELKDGNHFLMWDFDNVQIADVWEALYAVQREFDLSGIHVLSTGVDGYYHAYCFSRQSWLKARAIICSTDHVDNVFLMMGVLRGYFTLRFSKKRGRAFTHVCSLASSVSDSVNPDDVGSFVEYTTKNR